MLLMACASFFIRIGPLYHKIYSRGKQRNIKNSERSRDSAKLTNSSHFPHLFNRRFRNKCDIVEEPNSSSKQGIGVKFFSLITRHLVSPWARRVLFTPKRVKKPTSGI